MGWLKREQLQKRWGMRAYHYSLGDDAQLKLPVQGYSSSRPTADQQGSTNRGSAITRQSAELVEHLHGMHRVSSSASQKPFQTRLSGRTEVDTMSGSINRNTTSTNSLPGQNSPNSQGASRQTEQFHQRDDMSANPKVRNLKPLAFKTRAINHSTTSPEVQICLSASQFSRRWSIRKSSNSNGFDRLAWTNPLSIWWVMQHLDNLLSGVA